MHSFVVSTHRSVCTGRATCCGAFRSWTFPSLWDIVSIWDLLRQSLGADDIDVLISAVLARFWVWCRRSVSAELVSSKSRRLSEKDLRSWAWQRLRPTGLPYRSAEDLPVLTASCPKHTLISHLISPHLTSSLSGNRHACILIISGAQ